MYATGSIASLFNIYSFVYFGRVLGITQNIVNSRCSVLLLALLVPEHSAINVCCVCLFVRNCAQNSFENSIILLLILYCNNKDDKIQNFDKNSDKSSYMIYNVRSRPDEIPDQHAA